MSGQRPESRTYHLFVFLELSCFCLFPRWRTLIENLAESRELAITSSADFHYVSNAVIEPREWLIDHFFVFLYFHYASGVEMELCEYLIDQIEQYEITFVGEVLAEIWPRSFHVCQQFWTHEQNSIQNIIQFHKCITYVCIYMTFAQFCIIHEKWTQGPDEMIKRKTTLFYPRQGN